MNFAFAAKDIPKKFVQQTLYSFCRFKPSFCRFNRFKPYVWQKQVFAGTYPTLLEEFPTDSKIIRLISRRVVIFPAAAARQFFVGECDSANLKIYLHLCGLLGKWTEGFTVDKIPHLH